MTPYIWRYLPFKVKFLQVLHQWDKLLSYCVRFLPIKQSQCISHTRAAIFPKSTYQGHCTMWFHHNTLCFLQNTHNKQHPIVDLEGEIWGVFCVLQIWSMLSQWWVMSNWIIHSYFRQLPMNIVQFISLMMNHSDVVGASPVGAAPTTSSLST